MRRFSDARRWYPVWSKSPFSALPAHLVDLFAFEHIVPMPWLSCAEQHLLSTAPPQHHAHQNQEDQPTRTLLLDAPASRCDHGQELAN